MERPLQQKRTCQNDTEVEDTMSRDSSSQFPADEDADDNQDPLLQDAVPEITPRPVKGRMPVPQLDLFPGFDRTLVRRVIHRVTRNVNSIDDVEQRVSYIWHKNRWRRRLMRCPQAYLLRIAHNEATKEARRDSEERERFANSVRREQPLDSAFLREESADIAKEIAARSEIDRFKASLSPRLLSVLDLWQQGYEVEEIAQTLGIRFSTTKGYLAGIISRAEGAFDRRAAEPEPNSPQDPRKER